GSAPPYCENSSAHTCEIVAVYTKGGSGLGDAKPLTFFGHVAPTVVTEPASAVTATSATLNARVNPNNEEVTDCHFEYGTSTAYGSSVPCSSLPGSGETPVPVSARLSTLSQSTTYHARVVATNATGTSVGRDVMFTT